MSYKVISQQQQHLNVPIMDKQRNIPSITRLTFDNNHDTRNKKSEQQQHHARVIDKTSLLKLKEKRQRILARNSTAPTLANVSGTKFEIGIKKIIFLLNLLNPLLFSPSNSQTGD
jgi:hypothetical protein